MEIPQQVDTLFVFESGSQNTIIKDNHGIIVTAAGKPDTTPANQQPTSTKPLNRENFISAVNYTAEKDLILYKKDCEVFHKLGTEMGFFDKFYYETCAAILSNECNLPEDKRPSASSLKGTVISGTHPDWSIQGADADDQERIINIGTTFKQYFA